jgi:hypothetical protein
MARLLHQAARPASTRSIPAPLAGIVAVMALQAGGNHQVRGVAIPAVGTLVADAGNLAAGTGVRLVKLGRHPAGGVVALVASDASEQAGVKGGVSMARGTDW